MVLPENGSYWGGGGRWDVQRARRQTRSCAWPTLPHSQKKVKHALKGFGCHDLDLITASLPAPWMSREVGGWEGERHATMHLTDRFSKRISIFCRADVNL